MTLLRIAGADRPPTATYASASPPPQSPPTGPARNRAQGNFTAPTSARTAPARLTARAQQLAAELFLDPHAGGRVLGITSPLGGEGKSLMAAVLALSLARASDKRTVLIEATWQQPTISALFDLPTGPGLADWLRGHCGEASIRQEVGGRLVVIPAGSADGNELLLLERLQSVGLSALAGPDDFVIVDLPSVLSTSVARLATSLVERVIVVARAGVTPVPAIVDTCDQLKHVTIEGVVLNHVKSSIPRWLERIL